MPQSHWLSVSLKHLDLIFSAGYSGPRIEIAILPRQPNTRRQPFFSPEWKSSEKAVSSSKLAIPIICNHASSKSNESRLSAYPKIRPNPAPKRANLQFSKNFCLGQLQVLSRRCNAMILRILAVRSACNENSSALIESSHDEDSDIYIS